MDRVKTGTTLGEILNTINDNFDALETGKADINEVQEALQEKVSKSQSLVESTAVYLDANGKLASANVTPEELNRLAGVTSNIQQQLDALPKFAYLNAIKISVPDTYIDNQTYINSQATTALETEYPSVIKWNAVTVGITFTGSDTQKDALYYYNGTSWIFLNYVSTGINRAHQNTAGIVEDSDDITWNDGQGEVLNAAKAQKVQNKLTIKEKGSTKTFDGSGAVSIEIPEIYKIYQNDKELTPDSQGRVFLGNLGNTEPIIKPFLTTNWVGSSAPYTITLSLEGRAFNGVVYKGTEESNEAVLCDFSRSGDSVILRSDEKFNGFIEV